MESPGRGGLMAVVYQGPTSLATWLEKTAKQITDLEGVNRAASVYDALVTEAVIDWWMTQMGRPFWEYPGTPLTPDSEDALNQIAIIFSLMRRWDVPYPDVGFSEPLSSFQDLLHNAFEGLDGLLRHALRKGGVKEWSPRRPGG
jgi:hypothetical protein